MQTATHTPGPNPRSAGAEPHHRRRALLQHCLLGLAALAAAGLLLALVQTCQESMHNGDKWHAEQRAALRAAAAPT